MILDHNLEDIGLELTFSTEDHSFGRSRTIDLIPGGRTISVSEETKARYVDLVCQYRMTQSIENQVSLSHSFLLVSLISSPLTHTHLPLVPA